MNIQCTFLFIQDNFFDGLDHRLIESHAYYCRRIRTRQKSKYKCKVVALYLLCMLVYIARQGVDRGQRRKFCGEEMFGGIIEDYSDFCSQKSLGVKSFPGKDPFPLAVGTHFCIFVALIRIYIFFLLFFKSSNSLSLSSDY